MRSTNERPLAEPKEMRQEARLRQLDLQSQALEDAVKATRGELLRAQREKSLIEEHDLHLAEARAPSAPSSRECAGR